MVDSVHCEGPHARSTNYHLLPKCCAAKVRIEFYKKKERHIGRNTAGKYKRERRSVADGNLKRQERLAFQLLPAKPMLPINPCAAVEKGFFGRVCKENPVNVICSVANISIFISKK